MSQSTCSRFLGDCHGQGQSWQICMVVKLLGHMLWCHTVYSCKSTGLPAPYRPFATDACIQVEEPVPFLVMLHGISRCRSASVI